MTTRDAFHDNPSAPDHRARSIVHDVNNHLCGIIGCLHRMHAAICANDFVALETYVHAAQGAADRATSLTRRLLDVTGPESSALARTDINALMDRMAVLIRLAMPVDVTLDLCPGQLAGDFLIDAPQLENAILNLCLNARDAMPQGGVITLATQEGRGDANDAANGTCPEGRFVRVSVSDTGCGIPAANLPRIFDPLFTTKPAGRGTGLGLSIVRRFVADAGGCISVASRPGRGTILHLHLPCPEVRRVFA